MTNIRYYSHLDHLSFLSGRVFAKTKHCPFMSLLFFCAMLLYTSEKISNCQQPHLALSLRAIGRFQGAATYHEFRVIVQTVFKSEASPNAYSRCFLVIFRCLAAMAMPAI